MDSAGMGSHKAAHFCMRPNHKVPLCNHPQMPGLVGPPLLKALLGLSQPLSGTAARPSMVYM